MRPYFPNGALVFLFLFLGFGFAWSQRGDSVKEQKPSPNCIALTLATREHFDGTPLIQIRHAGLPTWMNIGLGLEYSRKIGLRHGLSVSIAGQSTRYYFDNVYPRKMGDVIERGGFFFEVAYWMKLLQYKHWQFDALMGVQYRHGLEFVLNDLSPTEINSTWYNLREPGISVGFKANRLLFWRIEFNSAVKFTQYFFRFDDGSLHGQNYPNRSTRNMLTIQAGLGFRF